MHGTDDHLLRGALKIDFKARLAGIIDAAAIPTFLAAGNVGSGGGTRTPDLRIMIPLL